MELKSLEDYIDLQLFYQTRMLICSTTDCTIPTDFYKRSLFGETPNIETITESYGFRYLGEVLERYRERCGVRLHQTRALALALAECYEFLTPAMFTGGQLYEFISQIEAEPSDFYLNCALLHIGDSTSSKDELFETVIKYPFKETQEALLAIYVLQKCIPIDEFAVRLATRFFGIHGTINTYNNEQLYFWFLSTYADIIRSYKSRELKLLHALLGLVCKNVKEDSAEYKTLLDAGYSVQEIAYMRITLPYKEGIPNSLKTNSAMAERIAYKTVKSFLEASALEHSCILQACANMLRVYSNYAIRIEGATGLAEHLGGSLKLNSIDTFKYLHTLPTNVKTLREWFYVDFSNNDWWPLYEWLSLEAFIQLFAESLLSHKGIDYSEWFQQYLEHLGSSYYEKFWQSSDSTVQDVLRTLVYADYYDVSVLLDDYYNDEQQLDTEAFQQKWGYIKPNLAYATRHLKSHTVFEFWRKLGETKGILQVGEFYKNPLILLDTTDIRSYQVHVSLCPEFLSQDEQRTLFDWIEQIVFTQKPTCYMQFINHFLLMKEAKSLFPEESKQLFLSLKENFSGYLLDKLCECYYTEEEYVSYMEEKEQQKEKQRLEERERKRQDYTDSITEELSDATDMSSKYGIIASYFEDIYTKGYEAEICFEFFKELFKECNSVPLKNATSIVTSLSKLVKWGTLSWDELQTIIQTMEVSGNES